MLYLISLGLRDEKDMSVRALETAKACDSLYAEFYTNHTATSSENLSEFIGKPVKELPRKGMENDAGKLIAEAKDKNVGVFVPGDALSATTHMMLLSEAREAGVGAEVIHGSSIFTAVAETGLQLYKFGRAVTLTSPVQESTLEGIETNLKIGLHTLVLLDIDMDANEGLGLLRGFLKDRKVIAACHLGGDNVIRYGTAGRLLENEQIKCKIPAVICIPGRLHFTEEEYLEKL